MIRPAYLKQGDKVAIVSPAGRIDKSLIDNAVRILSGWNLEVVTGKNTCNKHNQFAGTDAERLEDLQQMINDKEIKAVFASRGGYGTIRIIDKIDFKPLRENPKWVIGFSDITVLHAHINNNLNIETIHGIMPKNYPVFPHYSESLNSLKSTLFGENPVYKLNNDKLNIQGKTKGVLTGGNLSVLYSLSGTKFDFDYTGKILFIEDLNEHLYHIDRMLLNLKLSNKLNKLNGLIAGDFTNIEDNSGFGQNLKEIILNHTKEYGFPVCFGFPAGHGKNNIAMKFGEEVELAVDKDLCTIKYVS